MERLTYRDSDYRALLTVYGKQMYCSQQAITDCIAELEESLVACEEENKRLKHTASSLRSKIRKLESDASWDEDYRRGQVQGMW